MLATAGGARQGRLGAREQRAAAANPLWKGVSAGILLVTVLGWLMHAQVPGGVVVRGAYRTVAYDKAERAVGVITGRGAVPQREGHVVLGQFRYEPYASNAPMILATNCLYDPKAQIAASPDPVRIQTGDGRLLIEGVGFMWRQKDSWLVVSNQVHTRLSGVERAFSAGPP